MERVDALLSAGVRGNLIPRGLARGLIWQDGHLPEASPSFASELSDDLLEYGYTLLRLALLLRENSGDNSELARKAFERAAEAIEAVVRNGEPTDPERGFHRVVAACAYHLAHYSARSYSLLPSVDGLNLAPLELCVAHLLRRSLADLRTFCRRWLTDIDHSDAVVAEDLADNASRTGVDDVLEIGLTSAFLRGMAIFDFALLTGEGGLADTAVAALAECESAASELNLIPAWWASKLAKNLISDLWGQSLHQQLPPEISGGGNKWNVLRGLFISLLQSRRVAEIELWPSQIGAAKRVTQAEDDLVVSLPTSAGKTRIAEMCILRALAGEKRVVYVTPLRALSAQVERDLRETFQPLGYSVSSLYGASGEVGLDSDTLANRDIVVATPEKLDFAVRQDAALLDNVGLIVLDEGHTIGPGEREIRYEVLVQRLLKRSDARSRRLVCLSAILPKGEELDDFVSWIRQGDPGEAVVAGWRPTRQRFGTITWRGQFARLDLDVEDEKSFIQRFVPGKPFPGARTRVFPRDGAELTLASAWKISTEGRSALIFCPQRNLVESLMKRVIELHERGVLTSLVEDSSDLQRAKRVGIEWLGATHPAVCCLEIGVAVHHAGLPKAFLREIEHLLRARKLSVIISSPTLAQGLNLSASVLLMYSIRRGSKLISGEEFGNVIGRAGRARVDIDGQILYVLYAPSRWRLHEWEKLIAAARERRIQSGLFTLIGLVLARLSAAYELDGEELLEYVAGHSVAWDEAFTNDTDDDELRLGGPETLGSLDTAILALVERLDCGIEEIPKLLDDILGDSLWARTLARVNDEEKALQLAILELRAKHIWTNSTATQRRGYFAAGVSFGTGRLLDDNADELNRLLFLAEMAIEDGDRVTAIDLVLELATIVFTIPPFAPQKELPDEWQTFVREWLSGLPMSEIAAESPEELVQFIEDVVVYRLVWAVEAVRVRSQAHQDDFAELWTGRLAQALESGTMERSAVILVQAGLGSRIAALAALRVCPGDFADFAGMKQWLSSESVVEASKSSSWPTGETAELWRTFARLTSGGSARKWRIQRKVRTVRWNESSDHLSPGDLVRLRNSTRSAARTEVFTPDFTLLGELTRELPELKGIVFGTVRPNRQEIEVTYKGPDNLS